MEKNNNKYETPETKEALIDGLSFICQKLFMYFDGKKTNLMPISQLLVSLALPDSKQYDKVSSEEIFVAVEKVLSILDMMTKRRDSNLH
tara:strand:- start:374 stop:640 length:267 start_codon:yes stop_codon:yes gene_type:complete